MGKLKGVDTSQDSSLDLTKDLTPWHIKASRYIFSEGFWQIFIFAWLASFTAPNGFDLIYVIIFYLGYKNITRIERLPYKKPQSSGDLYDDNEINPGNGKASNPQGITFFGNEKNTNKEVWFTDSDVRTHCLIFGTTGAGKTETLLSICVNSLNQSSGFIYIDGKGDNGLWAKVFSLVAARGRLDDLYLINFMTGSVNLDKKSTERITNKMNPFATGNADSLTELIVSLLPDGGGDGMWKGRAAVFMGALLKALVFLRDDGKLLLDVDVVRKYFTLGEIIKLSRRNDIPKKYIDGIREYVKNLPGYIEPTPSQPDPQQPESVAEQHGYITMQYTETFGLLADTYAHIMKTQVAEIDFYDVVVNRRILVVLLPALEKSTQSLKNLGRIIVASIKTMMSSTLGSKVEGKVEEVIDTKPTNALSPYMTIFDEYGYYATEGAAVMPAQARSLGFFMIFAGQDYQAFKKGSEEEAASIVANCAIKICMKLEDATETLKIFQESAGRQTVIQQTSFDRDDESVMSGYMASKSISTNEKDIINARDLRDQDAGEAHMLFRDTTRRIKMFYAAPKPLKETRVNTFLEVEPPSFENVKTLKNGFNKISKKFAEIAEDPKTFSEATEKSIQYFQTPELSSMIKILNAYKHLDAIKRSTIAVAGYIEKVNIVDNKIVAQIYGEEYQNIKDNSVLSTEDVPFENNDFNKKIIKNKTEIKQEPIKNNDNVRKPEDNRKNSDNKNTQSVSNNPVKETKKDEQDKIFEGKDQNVDSQIRYIKTVLNNQFEEMLELEDSDQYFNSIESLENLGLDVFTLSKQIGSIENQLQNKMNDRNINSEDNQLLNTPDYVNLTVDKSVTDVILKTTQLPERPNKTVREMDSEIKSIIDEFFDED